MTILSIDRVDKDDIAPLRSVAFVNELFMLFFMQIIMQRAEIHAVPVIHADIHAVIHAVAFHAVDYHAVSCQLHGKRMAASEKQLHTHAESDMRARSFQR